jgi:hypothetical protein
MKKAAKVT